MEDKHQDQLAFLKSKEAPVKERVDAAQKIAWEVLRDKISGDDVSRVYAVMVQCWKNLGTLLSDRLDGRLFLPRIKLARQCLSVSPRLPEGQKFFCYHPKVKLAEGPNRFKNDEIIRGAITYKMFHSVYEFHYEYPIEGYGVQKDLISVITESGDKISILDWCKANDIIVYCRRCGLDITFEVSRNCPRRKSAKP